MISISLRGFGWTHAGRNRPALKDIDLEIPAGSRVLLSGNSGSGKSTLAAAIAGVLGGDEEGTAQGSIVLNDGTHKVAPGTTIPVGLVLQDPDSQVIAARVGDDVAFGCENLGIPREEIWSRVEQALAMVGLDVPLDHPTAHLSGGQKQRLALAGVMAMGAGLIVLDEPTANLDPVGAREVVAAVKGLVDSTHATLIVIEHNGAVWEGVLEKAIELADGHLAAEDSFAAVAARREFKNLPTARPVGEFTPTMWCENLLTRCGPPRNIEIPGGASTVVTGPNGAGKSTWMLTMAGLLPERAGEIGMSTDIAQGLVPPPRRWKSADLAQRIGCVFQNPEHQFVTRTVREELEIGPKVMRKHGWNGRGSGDIDKLVQRLRLEHLLDANPFTLSGGEKRRLSVATALVSSPNIVFFDEPTFGQDPQTFLELVNLLRELALSGVAIVSVTHDPHFIAALGDHHITITAGESA
ncbi:MAG: ABC transporter ATP-binding protein [Corynebacterium sp.]|nr:ABC transporter ATP-binding protein [Corynebacterium sp.]